ncbi:hypothetical protein B0T19DRAFT_171893 [Cercophora scortea]|uniref:Uncharacterized protein n=1 Tax=Cercophora scortea TaxID=314031 RepID=A0AAE0IMK6_9PEZI|nr:hypothetical protein B0T19DRAFT_171893 [Cercophora scortea]
MRAPVLVFVIVSTLAIGAIIEFLAQRSSRNGGLALSATVDEIPALVSFAYLYVPTIIAVVYSLIWTWVDLDIRRMQPWLELSRPEGAIADSSLLLDYPFEFLAFIPFSAWRRKHWPVFFSGTAMIILFWAITPLQSAVFGVKSVILSENTTMTIKSTLPSIQEQTTRMDTSILNSAYGVTWLGQSLPPFTVIDHALLPFSPVVRASETVPDESWNSTTTMLTTELNCWEASITKEDINLFNISNNRGCSVEVGIFQANNYNHNASVVVYVGYHEDAILDYYLEGPKCSTNSSNQFLAIWGQRFRNKEGYNDISAITASFCETSYHKQRVSVSVSAATGQPVDGSMIPMGAREQLDESEFNSTAFEFLLGVGRPPPTATRDYAASETIQPWPAVAKRDVAWPMTNMAGFALGLLGAPALELRNTTKLQDAFVKAHKALFSIAISQLVSPSRVVEESPGTIQRTLHGVVVSRPISAVLEGLLVVVAILVAAMLYVCLKTESNLNGDPASIGFTLRLLRKSQDVLDRFALEDCSDADTLRVSLSGESFALDKGSPANLRQVQGSRPVLDGRGVRNGRDEELRKEVQYRPVQPRELRLSTAAVLVPVLLFGAGVLIYLKNQEQTLHGLPRPSDNFEVLQIIENYIPTVLSTLLEPLLVVMARLLCVLQPFTELRKGKSSPRRSLEAKYTSLPPQLIVWRALKSRHFLLGVLCLISLLANALTVALGGVFNESPVPVEYAASFVEGRSTNLTRDTILDREAMFFIVYYDHFYTAWSNISANTTLPPWITADMAFLPVNQTIEQTLDNPTVFRTTARGFGVDSKCTPLSTSPSLSQSYANLSAITDGNSDPSFLYRRQNGTWTTCYPEAFTQGSDPAGRSAREVVGSLRPFPGSGGNPGNIAPDDGFCEDKMVLGWLRVDADDAVNSTVQSSFITCEATLQTAVFGITLDPAGHILSSAQAGEFDDITRYMTANLSRTLVRQANAIITDVGRRAGDYAWHNETVTRDWWNYLFKFYLNTTDLVDPSRGVPQAEAMVPVAQDLYRRLFAILVGQNLDMFQPAAAAVADHVPGVSVVTETRIFMDQTAFLASVVILCVDAAVLMMVYLRDRKAFLPRLPSTLGSLIAYVAASRAVRAYGEESGRLGGDGGGREKSWRQTYSFGRYIGVDGHVHIGIEEDPFVVPVDDAMVRKRVDDASGSLKGGSWFRRRGGPSSS